MKISIVVYYPFVGLLSIQGSEKKGFVGVRFGANADVEAVTATILTLNTNQIERLSPIGELRVAAGEQGQQLKLGHHSSPFGTSNIADTVHEVKQTHPVFSLFLCDFPPD